MGDQKLRAPLIITLSSALQDEESRQLSESGFTCVNRRGFLGFETLIDIIGQISAVSLPIIIEIAVSRIRAQRPVTVRYRGIEIVGISESVLLDMLQEAVKESVKEVP